VDPVRRDVVSLGAAGDNVTIRFETNNEGPWIMHWFVHSFNPSISIINCLNVVVGYSVISTGTSICKEQHPSSLVNLS
jgi:hypothetical protein